MYKLNKIKNLFLIFLIFIVFQCAGTPRKDFLKLEFSPNLKVKEFLSENPRILPAVIIYEPVFLKQSVLFRVEDDKEKGLIPALNKAGFRVYLVSSNNNNQSDYKQHAFELDMILNKIADIHKSRDVILAGTSLGGKTILEYMTLPANLDNYARVKKIFFIGTGVDYNYTGSFAEKSEKLGYENKLVKDLCSENKKDNFCTRYIYFNNSLEKVDNSRKENYFDRVPRIEKGFLARFDKIKLQLPYFFLYGKLDSISPEESIYPLFHIIRPSARGNNLNIMYEASEANGHSIDYDHADLFLYEKAEKEIYPRLIHWLKRK
jgi:pimeloyl-ACP methyl ester carboxylesterase